MPQVREVYYVDLSEDYAGRDVDPVIVLDKVNGDLGKVKGTLEAILLKLAQSAGIEFHALTEGGYL